jgi:CRISPR-associated protein Cmx8
MTASTGSRRMPGARSRRRWRNGGGPVTTERARVFDLATRVHGMVRDYVRWRTAAKSGIEEDFAAWTTTDGDRRTVNAPQAYREARERVCEDAFLAMRACRSRQDFVAYFTGTICAAPQFLPAEEFRGIAAALLADEDRWEEIRALSMLALSGLRRV